MSLFQAYIDSPVGPLKIESSLTGLKSIHFVEQMRPINGNAPEILTQTVSELEEYFAGRRKEFSVHLDPDGTPFQLSVWKELMKIPFGRTTSYIKVAVQLGDVKAIRAVGGANGKNPIPIIIPCHRVIGSNGQLTGYAGGLPRKRWLLDHEAVSAQLPLF
ncbi:MAG: methylated-DNA--[protein]-cysteine S-methyltransferase [Cyclobacteriaceae bacterium]